MLDAPQMKNTKEVVERILKAVQKKEKIILYGDSDLDGAASVILLKEALEALSPIYKKKDFLSVYFPNRETEGHGLNKLSLKNLAAFSPALLFTLDCGIGDAEEIELAKKMGLEVIVVDHHKVLPRIPDALIIDPKQEDDPYPFKDLCAAGVVYNLIKFLLNEAGVFADNRKYLELCALATISDQMPLIEENRKIVSEGLLAFLYTQRPGLKILSELTDYKGGGVEEIRQKINPPLNSADFKDHLNETYLLLIEEDYETALSMAEALINKSKKKKENAREVYDEIMARIGDNDSTVIFEGDPNWPLIALGGVASNLCNKFQKPVFLFKVNKQKENIGSARLPYGTDGVIAMTYCEEFLIGYGGHAAACGFRFKAENTEKFKEYLIKYFEKI